MGGKQQSAEQPAPEECPARPGFAGDPEQRNQSEEGQEAQRERREGQCAETDGREGQNQDSTDVSGTSLRVVCER
jgi:hypothetical protein